MYSIACFRLNVKYRIILQPCSFLIILHAASNVNYATVVGNGGYNGGQDLRFQTGLLGNDNHDWGNYTAGTFQLQTKNVANDSTMEDGSLICVTVSGSLA